MSRLLFTKSSNRAQLTAYVTSNAKCVVDGCLAVLHGNSRTSDLHAGLTSNALIVVNGKRRIVLNILKKRTWTP